MKLVQRGTVFGDNGTKFKAIKIFLIGTWIRCPWGWGKVRNWKGVTFSSQ